MITLIWSARHLTLCTSLFDSVCSFVLPIVAFWVVFFPLWSIPILIVLKICFRNLKGSLLLVSLSLPSLIVSAAITFRAGPFSSSPGLGRLGQLFGQSPFLALNAVIAMICLAHLLMVLAKVFEDPRLLAVWTMAGTAAILALDVGIVVEILAIVNEKRFG
jgi:hypothetical protein